MELELQGNKQRNIVFIGEQKVGKSTLINYFMNQQADMTYLSTVGINYQIKNVKKMMKNVNKIQQDQQEKQEEEQEKQYELKIWDTSGQLQYQNLILQQIKNIDCIVLCFDLDNPISLPNLEEDWIPLIQKIINEKTNFIVAGLKADLKQQKEKEEQEYQQQISSNSSSKKQQSNKSKFKKLNIKIIAKQFMQKVKKIFKLQSIQCLEVSVNNIKSVQQLFECDEFYYSRQQLDKLKLMYKKKESSLQNNEQGKIQIQDKNEIQEQIYAENQELYKCNSLNKSEKKIVSGIQIQEKETEEFQNNSEQERDCCKMCQVF
ncbi:P-loop containing nucleoside triphosphate hydrolase [Pseudocohnilembus persalinus]|uniref:p-loop containing nucleoside triphosphate hydrolase n=1 Tax=Pseudocohnilembus persalinus TaxID=266149 RepID=A0A0V0QBZ1_PSEPJ|nr:P-loop containing nucleoside triphosphate hydrolase [Pseudocohnilembus persalinus]|eukprot:KRW99772.1 P-loop containing nucleoside triphosphate hydrolase [Pseudocohnilembus persalinus]